ncbi:MAG TPA: pyruvate:ferredoxin (flavodoxin) oxidoreductase [Acidimicrobiales bacterium]|nr:pyruvate:ferredoxin (flavodoxin) oxidoreductase [Acidimicrobiales bacterium]
MTNRICVDGNEAAARVAYSLSEVIAIYPITPASAMGEHADDWAALGRPNLWGEVPSIVEMQSEAGAAGALHGALQKGSLATTFTASQGLLLMLPNMFKIAGELIPSVIHVAARSVATHALSIFGDHSDVMAARSTGWAMLCSSSVQEAQDFALVAHAAALGSRVPFLHFFDGFRTSHEVATIDPISDEDIRAVIDHRSVLAFKARGMDPDNPDVRGTAQNPDVFFQGREASNLFYDAVPGAVERSMGLVAERTGRRYGLVEYVGAPDAERVVVAMGSGCGAVEEVVDALVAAGERVGLVKVRLFRPFPSTLLVSSLPPTTRSVAVLDRCKEAGSVGEPLYLDVRAAIDEAMAAPERPFVGAPKVIGGRYGLSSKEFNPAMVKAVFDELAKDRPKPHFTVGITDDLTHLSLNWDKHFALPRPEGEVQAVFYGLGSDGTVGANKNSAKIIADAAGKYAQGYFVYDSKKSGAMTVSHLRFGPGAIRSTYLISEADFVACHQFGLLERADVLAVAKKGAKFLLNCSFGPALVWEHLSPAVRKQIVDKQLELWVVDAAAVASEAKLGSRVNTVMQVCFFALSDVIPVELAISRIKEAVERTYSKRGPVVVERNFAAIGSALAKLSRVEVPTSLPELAGEATPAHILSLSAHHLNAPHAREGNGHAIVLDHGSLAEEFLERVTVPLIAGEGDDLPTSALPADGRFPAGTSKFEKRRLAAEVPVWDPSICTDCAKCVIVCPHAALRMKVFSPEQLQAAGTAPGTFRVKDFRSKDLPGHLMSIQVSPDDCTGCRVCVEVCPAKSKTDPAHRSINMSQVATQRSSELDNWEFFNTVPSASRSALPHDTLKGAAVLEPLFEFSGACSGCGETLYLRLLSQLFGDRLLIANATGCSSIYGGNLPTTPWAVNAEGRGPAWANSLFEDNAEFGLGIRIGAEAQQRLARSLVTRLAPRLDAALVEGLLSAEDQVSEEEIAAQRERVQSLRARLGRLAAAPGLSPADAEAVAHLGVIAGSLVRKAVWIVGGDGWAYDIGFGGLDQVLASGADVNILVLDTEVYSNTGGQASKSTPRGAVARFAAAGKGTPKKDLASVARSYGNVYVAQVAVGANDIQTVKALLEAEAYRGPSLVIAYATCIAHGIDMAYSMAHQKQAVQSGYWPLYRFHPSEDAAAHPFHLDSKEPTLPVSEFVGSEVRYTTLAREHPEHARHLVELLQADTSERWHYYTQLAGMERRAPEPAGEDDLDEDSAAEGAPSAGADGDG